MSTQCKIHCHNCGKDYYVYERGINHEEIQNCPHCDAKMDSVMWKMIVDAILSVADVNYHFRKYNSERNEDLFDISIENVHIQPDKFRLKPR